MEKDGARQPEIEADPSSAYPRLQLVAHQIPRGNVWPNRRSHRTAHNRGGGWLWHGSPVRCPARSPCSLAAGY